eukprot:jgi/Botrbrau1/18089/Bobra.0062s0074.1
MHCPHLQMVVNPGQHNLRCQICLDIHPLVVNPGQNNLRCQTSILWYFPWYKEGG